MIVRSLLLGSVFLSCCGVNASPDGEQCPDFLQLPKSAEPASVPASFDVIQEPGAADLIQPEFQVPIVEQIVSPMEQMESLDRDVQQIRKELLLRRFHTLEQEAKRKSWKDAPPLSVAPDRAHFDEWKLVTEHRQELLDGMGVPELGLDQRQYPPWAQRKE